MSGKLLAIDFGTKRTGFAITDDLQIIATALTTIPTHKVFEYIKDLLLKEKISSFIVGFPKDLKGRNTNSTAHVSSFIKKLQKQYNNIPIFKIDERFTSKIAKQTILSSGVKKNIRKKKELVDKISATIILQSYLDLRR